ncbi:hypothetical protein Tco_0766992 [Tanacetum coccineum]
MSLSTVTYTSISSDSDLLPWGFHLMDPDEFEALQSPDFTLSSAEHEIQSMVDVPIHQKDPAVQRTPLIDTVISMFIEKTTSTPTPPTTQAQVTNVFEFYASLKFEQRLLELEKKVKTMPRKGGS